MTHDDETVERVAVWPLIHSLLVQFAPRIAEAEAATTHEGRIAIINGVSAHIAGKVEEEIDALSALPEREMLREALEALDRQRVWHEGHDKTLSKQPPNTDVRWRRLEHQEQAEDARAAADKIRAALEHQQKETP